MPRETNIPIVDSHLHLWNLDQLHLPWLDAAGPVINRSLGLAEFQDAVGDLPVKRAVYLEVDSAPEDKVPEAEIAVEYCRNPESPIAAAVIGGDPLSDDFNTFVKRFANEDCVKGLRSVLHTPDKEPNRCLKPEFIAGMRLLGELGLSFDFCMRRAEIHAAAELAAQCPETQFILDHCGGIGGGRLSENEWRVWREGIKALADQKNTVVKISGLVDPALGENWKPEDLAERVNFVLDTFGEDRVLFGGDWPVCLLGGSYHQWVSALRELVADRSETFQRKLFAENAARVYRLEGTMSVSANR